MSKIIITRGDTNDLILIAEDGDGNKVDLTGVTDMETQLPDKDGGVITIANDDHTPDADQTTNKGQYAVTLSAANSAELKIAQNQNVITKVTDASGKITFYHGEGVLNVRNPVLAT